MSDVLSQIQAQSAGLSSVEDLRKQAITQHGVDLGNFTGAMNAYRQGRQQIGQFSSTEKIDVVGLTSPITRRLGKAAYQKILKPGAKNLYEKFKATGRTKGEASKGEADDATGGEEMSDMGAGATRQVPEGSGVSDDGEQLTGDLSRENLTERFQKMDPEAREVTRDEYEAKTGSRETDGIDKPASEYEGGLEEKVGTHQDVSDAIGKGEADQASREAAEKAAAEQAEKEAAEKAAASAGEKATAEGALEEGGALAAESAIPGIGEIAMVGTLFYQLFHSIHKANKEEKDIQAPTAPGPLKLPTVDFDSAPVIDSSGFHAL